MIDTISLKMSIRGPNLSKLVKFLAEVDAQGPAVQAALRNAMVLGVLRSIRRTFLNRLQHALQLVRAGTQGPSESAREFAEINERTAGLQSAYEQMDDAIMRGDSRAVIKAQHLRDRESQKFQEMRSAAAANAVAKMSAGQNVQKEAHRMAILAMTGAMLKQRAMHVLAVYTDPSLMYMSSSVDGARVEAIDEDALFKIKTPSATEKLTGQPTESDKDLLWLQLEHGTGEKAVGPYATTGTMTAENGEEQEIGPSGWRYGGDPATGRFGGLEILGSHPMEAVFGQHTIMQDRRVAVEQVFSDTLDAHAPKVSDMTQ